jgi:hypothetical protein
LSTFWAKAGSPAAAVATVLPVVFLVLSGHQIEAGVTGVAGSIAFAGQLARDRRLARAIADDRHRLAIVEIPPEISQAELVFSRRAALQAADSRLEENFDYEAVRDGDALRARVRCKWCGWRSDPFYHRRFDVLSHLDDAHAELRKSESLASSH